MKYEKTQPGNPHRLTVNQHVLPVRCIERFAGSDGCVDVCVANRPNLLRLAPQNGLFRTKRTWDEKAERHFMKRIEDKFQELADKIVNGEVQIVEGSEATTVNLYFALWYHRSRYPRPDDPFVRNMNVTPNDLTKDQREKLEKNGVGYYGPEGMPARFIAGAQLQILTGRMAHHIRDLTWGVVHPLEGEFVMPDIPSHKLLPIDPTTCLAASHPSGHIPRENLREVNAALIAMSCRYYFARDMRAACHGLIWDAVKRAGEKTMAELSALNSLEVTERRVVGRWLAD
jgi:hypothetical protein